jgi:hypothetical protein
MRASFIFHVFICGTLKCVAPLLGVPIFLFPATTCIISIRARRGTSKPKTPHTHISHTEMAVHTPPGSPLDLNEAQRDKIDRYSAAYPAAAPSQKMAKYPVGSSKHEWLTRRLATYTECVHIVYCSMPTQWQITEFNRHVRTELRLWLVHHQQIPGQDYPIDELAIQVIMENLYGLE